MSLFLNQSHLCITSTDLKNLISLTCVWLIMFVFSIQDFHHKGNMALLSIYTILKENFFWPFSSVFFLLTLFLLMWIKLLQFFIHIYCPMYNKWHPRKLTLHTCSFSWSFTTSLHLSGKQPLVILTRIYKPYILFICCNSYFMQLSSLSAIMIWSSTNIRILLKLCSSEPLLKFSPCLTSYLSFHLGLHQIQPLLWFL